MILPCVDKAHDGWSEIVPSGGEFLGEKLEKTVSGTKPIRYTRVLYCFVWAWFSQERVHISPSCDVGVTL